MRYQQKIKGGPGTFVSRGDLNLGGDLKFKGGPRNPNDAIRSGLYWVKVSDFFAHFFLLAPGPKRNQ